MNNCINNKNRVEDKWQTVKNIWSLIKKQRIAKSFKRS